MSNDFRTLDLHNVSVILLRHGSKLRVEDVAKINLPPGVTQKISILTVYDVNDLQAIPDHLMKQAGWVRRPAEYDCD